MLVSHALQPGKPAFRIEGCSDDALWVFPHQFTATPDGGAQQSPLPGGQSSCAFEQQYRGWLAGIHMEQFAPFDSSQCCNDARAWLSGSGHGEDFTR